MSTSLRLVRSATLAAGVISMLAAAPAGAQRARRANWCGCSTSSPSRRYPGFQPRLPSPPCRLAWSTPAAWSIRASARAATSIERFESALTTALQQRRTGHRRRRLRLLRRLLRRLPLGLRCQREPVVRVLRAGYEEQVPPPSVTYSGYNPPRTHGRRLHSRPHGLALRDHRRGADGRGLRERRAPRLPVLRRTGRPARSQGPAAHDLLSPDGLLDDPAARPAGRVQGDQPPANAKACYAIDSMGNVVLRQ